MSDVEKELIINSDVENIRKDYYAKVKLTSPIKEEYINLTVEEKILPTYKEYINLTVEEKLKPTYHASRAYACMTADEAKQLRDMLIDIYPLSARESLEIEQIQFSRSVGDSYFVDSNDKLYYLVGDVAYPVKVKN